MTRTHLVQLRLTDQDYADLRVFADHLATTPTDCVRMGLQAIGFVPTPARTYRSKAGSHG